MIAVAEAIEHMIGAVSLPRVQTIALQDAAGRVLAEPVVAGLTQPPFNASAMDGYAVGEAAGTDFVVIGASGAGNGFDGSVGRGECVRIFTGAPVPPGTIAVIMQEKAHVDGQRVRFDGQVNPGQCIRLAGNDFLNGAQLLGTGDVLGPAGLSLAAAGGAANVKVFKRPRIAIISTGSELVELGQKPGRDQIIASNAVGLGAILAPFAARLEDRGIVGDQPETVSLALKSAFESADLVVSIGGVSVGDHDHVQGSVKEIGGKVGFWRVAMRPGKPVLFATLGRQVFLGLPGNPVSALVTARVLGLPLLRAMNGHNTPRDTPLRLPLATPLDANGPRQHYRRGLLSTGAGQTEIALDTQTDSAHLTSFAGADGLIVQPANSGALAAGHLVDVLML